MSPVATHLEANSEVRERFVLSFAAFEILIRPYRLQIHTDNHHENHCKLRGQFLRASDSEVTLEYKTRSFDTPFPQPSSPQPPFDLCKTYSFFQLLRHLYKRLFVMAGMWPSCHGELPSSPLPF